MLKNISYLVFGFIIVFFMSSTNLCQVDPQTQKYRDDLNGDIQYRRESILDGNNIRTLFDNCGMIGHWPLQPSGEWPKGTNHSYLDGFTFLVAAEVKAPGNNSFIHPLEIYYREWVDKDPITGALWTLAPLPRYFNPSLLTPALSTDPKSWPDHWPAALNLSEDWDGQWYSYFGKNNFYPTQESFYVLDDSKDKEFTRIPYNYFPVSADTDRGGLGLRVEVRSFQWSNVVTNDILFFHHDLYNISDYNYEKTIFGFYVDPGIGGSNDSGDDNTEYDKNKNLVYCFDSDGKGESDNYVPGYLGITFLETAKSENEQIGLTSLSVYRLGDGGVGGGWPKDDESMWQKLTGGFDIEFQNSNISLVIGSGPFQFNKSIGGSKVRVASALIFGVDYADLILNKSFAQKVYYNNYTIPDSIEQLNDFNLRITSNISGKEFSNEININWSCSGNIGRTKSYIYYTDNNKCDLWYLIGVDSINTKNFLWDIKNIEDGPYYKICVLSIADNGISVTQTGIFAINNSGKPKIVIVAPKEDETVKDFYPVSWLTSGKIDSVSHINLYCKPNYNRTWELIAANLKPDENYLWFTNSFSNSSQASLMGKIISSNDTSEYIVDHIIIDNDRPSYYGSEYFYDKRCKGTGNIEIHIIKQRDVTGDNYLLTFKQDPATLDTVYDVYDLNTGSKVVNGAREINSLEGPYFDGMMLKIDNVTTIEKNDSLTGWENSNSNLDIDVQKDNTSRSISVPADYRIEFSNTPQDTSIIDSPALLYRKLPVNFKVINTSTNSRNKIATRDIDANTMFSIGDEFQILEFIGEPTINNSRITWDVLYGFPLDGSTPIEPIAGDIFNIITTKPFLPGDSLFFSTQKLTNVLTTKKDVPTNFFLFQNYPNPFNPETRIRFQLAKFSKVKLKVFDLLGKEIETLVNNDLSAGTYEINFNGKNLSSGVYFLVLEAGNYLQSRKFVLMK